MAEVSKSVSQSETVRKQWVMGLLIFALVLTLARYAGVLPDSLHRLPEQFVPPLAGWLDAIFNFIKEDLHLIDFTRFLTGKDILELNHARVRKHERWVIARHQRRTFDGGMTILVEIVQKRCAYVV